MLKRLWAGRRRNFGALLHGIGRRCLCAPYGRLRGPGHGHAERKGGILERHVLLLQLGQELTQVFILELVAGVLGLEFRDFVLELEESVVLVLIRSKAGKKKRQRTSLTRASLRSLNAFCAARFWFFRLSALASRSSSPFVTIASNPAPAADFRRLDLLVVVRFDVFFPSSKSSSVSTPESAQRNRIRNAKKRDSPCPSDPSPSPLRLRCAACPSISSSPAFLFTCAIPSAASPALRACSSSVARDRPAASPGGARASGEEEGSEGLPVGGV